MHYHRNIMIIYGTLWFFLFIGVVATNQGVNVIHDKHFKAVTLSSVLPNNSTAVEKCEYSKNHFIFLKPENRDEWSHILSSFKICKSNLVKNAKHHKSV